MIVPFVHFGTSVAEASLASENSRQTCVDYAVILTGYIADSQQLHGSAHKMVETAWYNITMAATIMIADMADHDGVTETNYAPKIDTCIQALKEIEESYIIVRMILKHLKHIMKRCRQLNLYEDLKTVQKMSCSFFNRCCTRNG